MYQNRVHIGDSTMIKSNYVHDLTDFRMENQFRKVDVVIIKIQMGFFEAWHYLAETNYEGEAISCIIRDYRHLITSIREINNTVYFPV